jgi:hypothetical protein
MAKKKKRNCGKRLYTLDETTRVVLRANANRPLAVGSGEEEGAKRPLRTYFCQRCGGYHLTSKEYGDL